MASVVHQRAEGKSGDRYDHVGWFQSSHAPTPTTCSQLLESLHYFPALNVDVNEM